MIYFDCAATSLQKPPEVAEQMLSALYAGNAGRGAHEASLAAGRIVYETREKLADLFGMDDPMRVCMMLNATDALNTAIHGLIGAGDHVITTASEHNSVLRPLYRAREQGAELTIVPADEKGIVKIDDIFAAVRSNTHAIVCAHASNLTGNVLDIEAIGQFCKKKKILFIVDAAQSAGTLEIDMKRMGISVLCAPGHKGLFGPQGTGFLCAAKEIQPRPFRVGGSGVHSFSETHPTDFPTALEAGTLNTPGIAGLSAGLDFIQQIGISAIHAHEQQLAERFYRGIIGIKGVMVYGDLTQKNRAAIITLNLDGMSADRVSDLLMQNYGIAVRAGSHCAPLLHYALGTADCGAVRFSFGWYNTEEEVDIAIHAIQALCNDTNKRLIITFRTTAMALKMEKICHASGTAGRLIPVPREITAGCGLSWMAEPSDRTALEEVMRQYDITPQEICLI